MVVALEQHDRGLVGAGRLGQRAGPGDEHEPGHRRLHVADAVGEHLQPVQPCGGRGAHRGVVGLRALLETLRRRPRSTASGTYTASGRCSPIQPRTWAHACEWVPTARTSASVGAGAGREHEGHRHEHLAGDDERVAAGEGVERGGDAALDGVLDRHHRAVDVAGAQGGQRRVDRAVGRALATHRRLPGVERHRGEGALGAEVAEAGHGVSLPVRAAARACCSSGVRVASEVPPTTPLA